MSDSVDTQVRQCPGGGRPPRQATTQYESGGPATAACFACFGRFRLDGRGLVPAHAIPAAPLDAEAGLRVAA